MTSSVRHTARLPGLGVVHVVYGTRAHGSPSVAEIARRAKADGFQHLVAGETAPNGLALPVSCRYTRPPRVIPPSTYVSPLREWSWDQAVDIMRGAPQVLFEPYAFCAINTNEKVREFCAAVPGLRLLLDTGHVACWGGDPIELLDLADHIQLRQARPGIVQASYDDGVVDFAAVAERLVALDYRGVLSIEYFDLEQPEYQIDDPRRHAIDLARYWRTL